MSYKIGDYVNLGQENGTIVNIDLTNGHFYIKNDSGFIGSYNTLYLDIYNKYQSKFNVGDKVRFIIDTGLTFFPKGSESIILQIDDVNNEIKIESIKFPGNYCICRDFELEIIPQGIQSSAAINQQTLSGRAGYAPIGGWSNSAISFKDVLNEYNNEISKAFPYHDHSSKLHVCTWKTYTGLMYKEDYCECGQTKNKRGIYE